MSLFLYGASYDNYIQFEFYKKGHKYRNSFITKTRTFHFWNNYEDRPLCHKFYQKDWFNCFFAKYVHRSWLTTRDGATEEQIRELAKKNSEFIIKPINESKGIGVRKVTAEELISDEVLKDVCNNPYIIEERLINCDEIRALCPNSLNTIRIVTFRDKYQKTHILAVNLRMGNGNSITDNICTGGIGICIDSETETLAEYGRNVRAIRFEKHPLTGISFKGYKIPRVKESIELVIELANKVPTLRIIGWDIVITPDNIEVLEANIPPGEEMTEYDLKGKYHFVKSLI